MRARNFRVRLLAGDCITLRLRLLRRLGLVRCDVSILNLAADKDPILALWLNETPKVETSRTSPRMGPRYAPVSRSVPTKYLVHRRVVRSTRRHGVDQWLKCSGRLLGPDGSLQRLRRRRRVILVNSARR